MRHVYVTPPREPTKREVCVLRFISDRTRRTGYPPSYREICEEFGFRSTNAAADNVRSLRRKGLLTQPDRPLSRVLSLTKRGREYLGEEEEEVADVVLESRCDRCNAVTFAPHPRSLCLVLKRLVRIGDASFLHESPLHAGGSR